MNLSENVKRIRKENNLSQEQLAEKLGVSRQSVSKWESGQAYPEMDKVIQICELFNINMDDLMKADLKEVREAKQSRANINKYIDEFLGFITKTIDMFSSLKFKNKIKCLIEQGIIAICLFIILLIIGSFGSEIFRKIFGFISEGVYWWLYNLFEAIYLIFATFAFVAVFLHVFKVRYLDYYVIVHEDKELDEIRDELEDNLKKNKTKIELSKKTEKIIIRDPKHSGYKFLNGILECALFFIKLIVFFIGLCFLITLFMLGAAIIMPFLVVKAGFIFGGSLICVICAMVINYVILRIVYNFLFNKKSKKGVLGICTLISVFLLGVGGGIFAFGLANIKYVDEVNSKELVTKSYNIEMSDNLVIDLIHYKNKVEYIESDFDDVRLEVIHSKYSDVSIYEYATNSFSVGTYFSEYKAFDLIKALISDLNNYEIYDREYIVTKIYASKDNIAKLQENLAQRRAYDRYYEEEINSLYDRINDLENNC